MEEVKVKPWRAPARDIARASARANELETESARRDCPWKCYPGNPACVCDNANQNYSQALSELSGGYTMCKSQRKN